MRRAQYAIAVPLLDADTVLKVMMIARAGHADGAERFVSLVEVAELCR
jgi:hypothetical protein